MPKSLKPSLTQVRKILKRASFNPRKFGKLKVIADMEDSSYYERQAQVLIEEARAIRLSGLPLTDCNYDDKLIQAMQLLTLAVICK